MRQLFIIRHGVAEDAAPSGADRDRALTERGLSKLRAQVAGLARLAMRPDVLFTSPYARAQQTAALLAPAWDLAAETDEALAPGASLADVRELAARCKERSFAIVGHQPDLGVLLEELTGARVRFRKGAVAVVDVARWSAGGGALRAFYDPDEMILLAGEKPV